MKPLLKTETHALLLASLLPCFHIASAQAESFEYSGLPDSPNRVLLESNLSFDGSSLTYGHLYSSIYELTDMDDDGLPERAFMLTEPGISCLTLVYVPSTQLWQGDISSSDLSAFARVRNIGSPYLTSSDALCQGSAVTLQSIEIDLNVESIADISGDGKRDLLINDFELVPTILVSGDLVPGVIYDAADPDSHVATNMTTGYINTILEDVDQDGVGEISIAWNPATDSTQTTFPIADCAIYAGGIGNFPVSVEQQDFSADNTLYLRSEEYCSYAQNIGDVNGDGAQDLKFEAYPPSGTNSVSWIIHGGSYLQEPDSLMPASYQSSGNAYTLEFNTTSGDFSYVKIRGIGDFDADGYDDVVSDTLQKYMNLALTAPGTGYFNDSAVILYGNAEGLPRDLNPAVLDRERVSQILHFGQLQQFTDVNNDGAMDLTTEYPFSVYLGTPGQRYPFLLPGGTGPGSSYQLEGYEYGVDFGELTWNISKQFVLVWRDDELIARTETNSLMIPRDIDAGGTFYITSDFLGQDPANPVLASDFREPFVTSNTVTVLADEGCEPGADNTIMPQISGLRISWTPVCAKSINIHSGNGDYLTTLPGDATQWTAPEPGDYFFVSTNTGSWSTWQRSPLVTLSAD